LEQAQESVLARDDGNFFCLSHFKAKTHVQEVVQEFLYADDPELCASTPERLQNLLYCFTDACEKYGLTIVSDTAHTFTINDNSG